MHCDGGQNSSKDKDNAKEDPNKSDTIDMGPHCLNELFKQK